MRSLFACLTAAALAAVGLADDKKADEKSAEPAKAGATRAERFQAILKGISESQRPLNVEFQKAKSEEEKQAVIKKSQQIMTDAAGQALKFAEEDPKDDAGRDALVFVIQSSGGTKSAARATELLTEHHAASPKILQLVQRMGSNPGGSGQLFLKEVLEKNPEREIKAYACYGIGQQLAALVDSPLSGKPEAEKVAARVKEAEKYLGRVKAEFGDVKLPRGGTLGEMAERELFAMKNLIVGKVMPDAECADLDGKKVKISDHKGKVVVLDIWATWCGPCVAMIPHEREMVERLKDKPFALISVSADADKKTLTDFLAKERMPWTHWHNGATGGLLEKYNVKFFPTIYVLDAKGVIRHKNLRFEALEKAVNELLKEAN